MARPDSLQEPTIPSQVIGRRDVRLVAIAFLLLGVTALIFDLVSPNPGQLRYALGAVFLTALSAITFHQAR